MKPTLQDLQNRINAAATALGNAIAEKWPKGTPVAFIRRHGQRNPSTGTVAWVSGETVGVSYETQDRYRGLVTRYKRVHWRRILD